MRKKDNLEKLRNKLNKVANLENLLDKEIIDLSQELDVGIVNFYKEEEILDQEDLNTVEAGTFCLPSFHNI